MLIEGKDYKFENNTLMISENKQWIPIVIDGYTQINVLHPGANGITILASHNILKRDCVIKVWKPRTNDLKKYKAQFLAEIQKISSLDHPNIAKIYDANILESGYCYAIMEYIDGCTLEGINDPQKSKYFTNKKKIFRNLILGLLAYQTKGIVHGDIHAGNIMITKDSNVRIIDFGTSQPFLSAEEHERRKEYSIQRELYREYQSVISILKDYKFFNESHFIFQIHHDNDLNKCRLDIPEDLNNLIKLEPILLTETLLSYSIILEALEYKKIDEPELIQALAYAISNSSYLNIGKIMEDFIKQDNIRNEIFFKILRIYIEGAIYIGDEVNTDYINWQYFYTDLIDVISLQAYIDCLGNEDNDIIPNDITQETLQRIYRDYNSDAIKLYEDDIDNMHNVRNQLFLPMLEINDGWIVYLHYYMNSTIRNYLLNSALVDRIVEVNNKKINSSDYEYQYNSRIYTDSIPFFFNYINQKLFKAYDLLVLVRD